MGEKGKSDYDNVSQALAYYHLKKISEMLGGSSSPDSGNKAHRLYLVDLIKARVESM